MRTEFAVRVRAEESGGKIRVSCHDGKAWVEIGSVRPGDSVSPDEDGVVRVLSALAHHR